jgi:hypothetical protein
MHGKKGSSLIDYSDGGKRVKFQQRRRVTLTIGKTVLQPMQPTVGNKGPRSQPYLVVHVRENWMILQ